MLEAKFWKYLEVFIYFQENEKELEEAEEYKDAQSVLESIKLEA